MSNWKSVLTNSLESLNTETKNEKMKRLKYSDRSLKATKRNKSIDNLKNESDLAFTNKTDYEFKLLEAYESKRLKSKALIEKAKEIQKNKTKKRKAEPAS